MKEEKNKERERKKENIEGYYIDISPFSTTRRKIVLPNIFLTREAEAKKKQLHQRSYY